MLIRACFRVTSVSKVFCISTCRESAQNSLRLAKFLISFASSLHDNSKIFLIEFNNAVSVILFVVFPCYKLEWKISRENSECGEIIFNSSLKENYIN